MRLTIGDRVMCQLDKYEPAMPAVVVGFTIAGAPRYMIEFEEGTLKRVDNVPGEKLEYVGRRETKTEE